MSTEKSSCCSSQSQGFLFPSHCVHVCKASQETLEKRLESELHTQKKKEDNVWSTTARERAKSQNQQLCSYACAAAVKWHHTTVSAAEFSCSIFDLTVRMGVTRQVGIMPSCVRIESAQLILLTIIFIFEPYKNELLSNNLNLIGGEDLPAALSNKKAFLKRI